MKLFHYTNAQNAVGIFESGMLWTGADKRAAGKYLSSSPPDELGLLIDGLLWLTTSRQTRQAWQMTEDHNLGLPDFKWHVRFEMDTDAEPWQAWVERTGFPEWYAEMLAYEGTDPDAWYVREGSLPLTAMTSVTITEGEKKIWTPRHGTEAALVGLRELHAREQDKLFEALSRGSLRP